MPVRWLAEDAGVGFQETGFDTGLGSRVEHFTFDHHIRLGKAKSTGRKGLPTFQESWCIVFNCDWDAERCYWGE